MLEPKTVGTVPTVSGSGTVPTVRRRTVATMAQAQVGTCYAAGLSNMIRAERRQVP